VDQTALVGPDIQAGRDFLELLDRSGVPVTAAWWQWHHFPVEEWGFSLATRWVDQYGLKETYRKIDAVLSKASPRPAIDLMDVNIYTPEASAIKFLRHEFRRARDLEVKNRSFGDEGVLWNAYIYVVK
jgi:hypothetical protein